MTKRVMNKEMNLEVNLGFLPLLSFPVCGVCAVAVHPVLISLILCSISEREVFPGASTPSSTRIHVRGWPTGHWDSFDCVHHMSCPCNP